MDTGPIPKDRALIRFCVENDCLDKAKDCWFTCLAQNGKLLLSNPSFQVGKWFIGCDTSSGSCVLGIPVEEVAFNGATFYSLSAISDFAYLPILQPTVWQAMTFTWKAPLSMRLEFGEWPPANGPYIKPTIAPTDLLSVCARNAFWRTPKTGLTQLAKKLGFHLDSAATVPEMVLDLAEQVLGELSDADKLEILRCRLPAHDECKEFLMTEEAKELLGDDEAKQVEKMKESETKGEPVHEEFKKATKRLALKIKEFQAKQRKGGGAAGSRTSRPPAKRQRRYPPALDFKSGLTVEYLNTFVPDGSRVGVDHLDRNWRLSAFGGRHARAWGLYGDAESAKILIRLAWELAVNLGHETECPFREIAL